MKTIYVVAAREDWEPDMPIRAYTDHGKAERFCEKCNKHQDKAPSCPDGDTDKEWDEWEELNNEWKSNHPATGHTSGNEEFVIRELGLYR